MYIRWVLEIVWYDDELIKNAGNPFQWRLGLRQWEVFLIRGRRWGGKGFLLMFWWSTFESVWSPLINIWIRLITVDHRWSSLINIWIRLITVNHLPFDDQYFIHDRLLWSNIWSLDSIAVSIFVHWLILTNTESEENPNNNLMMRQAGLSNLTSTDEFLIN